MWKTSLKNVESDNNNILYETLLDFFSAKRYLLSEKASYKNTHFWKHSNIWQGEDWEIYGGVRSNIPLILSVLYTL